MTISWYVIDVHISVRNCYASVFSEANIKRATELDIRSINTLGDKPLTSIKKLDLLKLVAVTFVLRTFFGPIAEKTLLLPVFNSSDI